MNKISKDTKNYHQLQKNICDSFFDYIEFFPEERKELERLEKFLTSKEKLNSRKNMSGHVTASGIVVNDDMEILLIFHRASSRYLQPGGHVDDCDASVYTAALREIIEETGIKKVSLHSWHKENNFPVNIDIHKINARPEKNEEEHFHYDYMYIFRTDEENINLQLEEVSDFRWISIKKLPNNIHIKTSIKKALNLGLL